MSDAARTRASEPQPSGGDGFDAPRHVAIIMDGNGRWAAARGLPRIEGHRRGVEALRRTVRAAGDLGIAVLTIFSFSSENWSRPLSEISDLMGLLRRFIRNDLADLHKSNVRVRVIGERLVRIALGFVFPRLDERDLNALLFQRLALIHVRHEDADRTALTAGRAHHFAGRGSKPVGGAAGERIAHRDNRLLIARRGDLGGKLRDSVDAAAGTVDIEDNRPAVFERECLRKLRLQLLDRRAPCWTGDRGDQIHAVTDDASNRNDCYLARCSAAAALRCRALHGAVAETETVLAFVTGQEIGRGDPFFNLVLVPLHSRALRRQHFLHPQQ